MKALVNELPDMRARKITLPSRGAIVSTVAHLAFWLAVLTPIVVAIVLAQ